MGDKHSTGTEQQQIDCAGKHPYASFDLASRVAGRAHGKNVRASSYKCPACNKWHVGSRFGKKKKR